MFDHVFVPWERVFLCGEAELAGKLALLFALYHRHSYTGCKAALSEIMTGATALAAEYNGIQRAQHVRHKLAEMIQIIDLIFASGIAAAVNATRADSGTYIPDTNYCNAGRMLAGEADRERAHSRLRSGLGPDQVVPAQTRLAVRYPHEAVAEVTGWGRQEFLDAGVQEL